MCAKNKESLVETEHAHLSFINTFREKKGAAFERKENEKKLSLSIGRIWVQ